MLKTHHLGLRLARRLAGGRPLLFSLVRHSRPARRRLVASPQDFFGLHTGCPGRAPALLGSADMCRRSPHRSRAVVRWAIIWKVQKFPNFEGSRFESSFRVPLGNIQLPQSQRDFSTRYPHSIPPQRARSGSCGASAEVSDNLRSIAGNSSQESAGGEQPPRQALTNSGVPPPITTAQREPSEAPRRRDPPPPPPAGRGSYIPTATLRAGRLRACCSRDCSSGSGTAAKDAATHATTD